MTNLNIDDKKAIFDFIDDTNDAMDSLVSQVQNLPVGDIAEVSICFHALQVKMVLVTLNNLLNKTKH